MKGQLFSWPGSNRKRSLTPSDKKRIAAKQRWKCRKCGKTLPARYHIDHIKEFSSGGSDRASNLQALCPNCHADKTERERHRKRQQKIREREGGQSGGFFGSSSIFGSQPRRRKSPDILGVDIFGSSNKKKRKKKSVSFWDI